MKRMDLKLFTALTVVELAILIVPKALPCFEKKEITEQIVSMTM